MVVAGAQLEPASFRDVDGWEADDHAAAFATFLTSCRAMGRTRPARAAWPVHNALRELCRRALASPARDATQARAFFEENFRPVRISALGANDGLLTGYFEPEIDGARRQSETFPIPVYRRPQDYPRERGAGVPYLDRAAIEDGALAGRNLEICWVRDANDLFFMQVQGSARVRFDDGKIVRLSYDGSNNWPYTPIGRVLIERGIVAKEDMSMDRIREWMAANPAEAAELRRQNRRYIFFRERPLADHVEAVGAQGVPLTPGRSVAVDRTLFAYGTPFFIEGTLPLESLRSADRFRRLMVAQDTGSAIVGPARADIYFGAGKQAGSVAGRIRHRARFVMLVPNAASPVALGARVPLPSPRPDGLK